MMDVRTTILGDPVLGNFRQKSLNASLTAEYIEFKRRFLQKYYTCICIILHARCRTFEHFQITSRLSVRLPIVYQIQ